jgi:disulfide bond formation protein DsbB
MSQVLHFIEKLWEIYVKRFHLNNAILSFSIIVLAWIMDVVLALYACPLCILTRYVFGTFAFFSLIAALPEEINLSILGIFISLNDRFKNLQNIFIFGSLFFGVGVTSRQIYIQNLSSEGLTNLSGCGMPLETTIEFYGFLRGIYKTLQGGPSCAEEGWRFIFNFAEWGLIFFLIFIFVNLLNVFKVLKKV